MAELWVFGYGSLMWRPGFEFSERAPAALIGAHRSLCIYSFHHRGTHENPGLVLGLDEGGACRGVAFRVAPDKSDADARLSARTRADHRGLCRGLPGRSACSTARAGSSRRSCYVVDRAHPQYAGRLSTEAQARLVRSAVGGSGTNIDYVLNTVRHLEEAGIHDVELMALAAHLAAEPG